MSDDETRVMFRHVLLAVEGPRGAERCQPWLRRLTGSPAGRVRLLAVLGPAPTNVRAGGRVVAYTDQQEEAARLGARAALQRCAADLGSRGFEVSFDASFGDPISTILTAAADVDLIALAATDAPRRFAWRPTVVDGVLRRARVPVFVVRRRGQRAA